MFEESPVIKIWFDGDFYDGYFLMAELENGHTLQLNFRIIIKYKT